MLSLQDDLQQNIRRLLGYDEVVRRPTLSWLPSQLLRILGLPGFPSKTVQNHGNHKRKATPIEDLLTGLYLHRQALVYIILSQDSKLKVLLGLAGGQPCQLANMLRGAYPGILTEETVSEAVAGELQGFPFCAFVRGIPSPKEENGIDRLLHSLSGTRWAYAVIARPLDSKVACAALENIAAELRRVKDTFLRSHTAEQDNNPLAQYYFDLLKAAFGQYKVGQVQGCWESETYFLTDSRLTLASGMGMLGSILCGDESLPSPVRVSACLDSAGAPARPTILNTPQLGILVQLPSEEMPGYQVIPAVSFASALPERAIQKPLVIGSVLQAGRLTGEWCELELDDITKHALVTGVTGIGKTETCHFILDQLWREYRIPYLVLEPAKREYPDLRHIPGHETLTVLSPSGTDGIPLRLNPFEVGEGTPVQRHIDSLRCLFNASFAGLYPPMPYLLEEALYRVYQEKGWDITTGRYTTGQAYPTLNDFCATVEDIAFSAGYDSETTQNISTSLRVRLNSWRVGIKGLVLNNPSSIPFDLLMTKPAVVELSDIADPEVVSFIMGLILIRLYEHLAQQQTDTRLKHVVLVEEAHRLLAKGLDNSGNIEVSNIRGQAVETFCNMLAEVRAYGEGLIIVDQSPTKLHSDAIKGTNLKIIHRLVAEDDRRAIGGSTNMTDDQQKFLAVLKTGEAVVYAEGFHQPYLVRIPEIRRYVIRSQPRERA